LRGIEHDGKSGDAFVTDATSHTAGVTLIYKTE